MPSRDRGPFRTGETVLVPHTDQYYVAKIVKSRKQEDGQWYLLHYKGWNKKYDEWVLATDIKKYNKELAPDETKKPGRPGATRRKKDSTAELMLPPTDAGDGQHLRLILPAALKQILMEDEHRMSQRKVSALPVRPCVAAMLADYRTNLHKPTEAMTAEEESAFALQMYFDKSCFNFLLYPAERTLATEALRTGLMPSHVYGGVHLLRLFYKLPDMLPVAHLNVEALEVMERRIHDIISFLDVRREQYFEGYAAAAQTVAAPSDPAAG